MVYKVVELPNKRRLLQQRLFWSPFRFWFLQPNIFWFITAAKQYNTRMNSIPTNADAYETTKDWFNWFICRFYKRTLQAPSWFLDIVFIKDFGTFLFSKKVFGSECFFKTSESPVIRIGSPLHTHCGIVGGGEPLESDLPQGQDVLDILVPTDDRGRRTLIVKTIYLFKMVYWMS